jgi:hypothetical protein
MTDSVETSFNLYSTMADDCSVKNIEDGRVKVSCYAGADDSDAPLSAWT